LEAAVVVYLRAILRSDSAASHPERQPYDLFPLITQDQLLAAGRRRAQADHRDWTRGSNHRMLAGLDSPSDATSTSGWRPSPSPLGLGHFVYAFLKMMIHWPESLTTWDILFLIPLLGSPRAGAGAGVSALIVCG